VEESHFRRQFSELLSGPDEAVDVARASLLIAAEEYPELDVGLYLARLQSLGGAVRERAGASAPPENVIDVLNRLLFEDEGFRGNNEDYYDPRNSYLNEVLDRRTGIPITLSTVYMEVARHAGLDVEGVGLPGHFIVKATAPGREILLDPFHGGARLTEGDCQRRLDRIFEGRVRVEPTMLTACARKEILARMLRNLKTIYAKAADHWRCLGVVDLLLRVNSASGEDLRDRGLLYAALDCYGLALADLRAYLARFPEAPEAADLATRIALLSRQAARLN
jgi:regulator of sirC expression with transglutaminase-like and TPR domain